MNTANLLLREVTGDIIPIDNFQPAKVNLPEVVESEPQERANSANEQRKNSTSTEASRPNSANEQRKNSTSTEASRPNTDSTTPAMGEVEDIKENEEEKVSLCLFSNTSVKHKLYVSIAKLLFWHNIKE